MNHTGRCTLFLVSALVLGALLVWGYRDLPPVGDYRGPYGDAISGLSVYERHTTDVVNAITYDYRGFDTLGEEFILFASVTGVLLLFRKQPNQDEQGKAEAGTRENRIDVSDAIRVTMMAMVGVMVAFGVYIALHGQLTPGGGFQGGVVLATAPLVVYLSGRAKLFNRIVSHPLIVIADSTGAAGYALLGVAGMIAGANFLTNVFPLGTTGDVFSSGTIAMISAAVGLEVAGGFTLLIHSYLEEILESKFAEGGS